MQKQMDKEFLFKGIFLLEVLLVNQVLKRILRRFSNSLKNGVQDIEHW